MRFNSSDDSVSCAERSPCIEIQLVLFAIVNLSLSSAFEFLFYLFQESTYGTHIHENRDEREKRFTSKRSFFIHINVTITLHTCKQYKDDTMGSKRQ